MANDSKAEVSNTPSSNRYNLDNLTDKPASIDVKGNFYINETYGMSQFPEGQEPTITYKFKNVKDNLPLEGVSNGLVNYK